MRSTKRCSTTCSADAGAGHAGARKQTAAAAEDAGVSRGVFRLHRGQSAGFRGWCKGVDAIGREAKRADAAGCREYFRPIFREGGGVLREGIRAGEFRAVNPMDFLPSVVAVIMFYFSAAPLMKTLMKVDPLSAKRIRERRAFVLDFISAALFV
jgi:hypothetical protein